MLGPDHYVLMSLLPGASLDKNESWRHDEKNVRAAFDRAIKAVHDCGIASKSTNRRNVLWDEIQGKWYVALPRPQALRMSQTNLSPHA